MSGLDKLKNKAQELGGEGKEHLGKAPATSRWRPRATRTRPPATSSRPARRSRTSSSRPAPTRRPAPPRGRPSACGLATRSAVHAVSRRDATTVGAAGPSSSSSSSSSCTRGGGPPGTRGGGAGRGPHSPVGRRLDDRRRRRRRRRASACASRSGPLGMVEGLEPRGGSARGRGGPARGSCRCRVSGPEQRASARPVLASSSASPRPRRVVPLVAVAPRRVVLVGGRVGVVLGRSSSWPSPGARPPWHSAARASSAVALRSAVPARRGPGVGRARRRVLLRPSAARPRRRRSGLVRTGSPAPSRRQRAPPRARPPLGVRVVGHRGLHAGRRLRPARRLPGSSSPAAAPARRAPATEPRAARRGTGAGSRSASPARRRGAGGCRDGAQQRLRQCQHGLVHVGADAPLAVRGGRTDLLGEAVLDACRHAAGHLLHERRGHAAEHHVSHAGGELVDQPVRDLLADPRRNGLGQGGRRRRRPAR
jgi:hypothetical protein